MDGKLKAFVDSEIEKNAAYGMSIKGTMCQISSVVNVDNVMNMSLTELQNLLILLKPISKFAISVYLSRLRKYAEYIGCQRFIDVSNNIDVEETYMKSVNAGNHQRKYLSDAEFNDMIFNLQMMDILNVEYFTVLLRAIYEGIYSDDLSALTNLRAGDIHGNVVTVKRDGQEPFELEVSHELAYDLKDLSISTSYERKNRYGIFTVQTEGLYGDSVFKTETRSSNGDKSYAMSYYRYLRKVSEEIDFKIIPKCLYISGIVNRIKAELESNNMTLENVVLHVRRTGEDMDIFKRELERCHYPYGYSNVRNMILGYLEDFK